MLCLKIHLFRLDPSLSWSSSRRFFCFVVFDGGLNRVFSKHWAVKLDWWQLEVLGDILVLDFHCIFNCHTLEELCGVRTAGNRWTAAECLKNGLFNRSISFVHFDLKFHDITASRSTDETRAYINCVFVKGADISWVLVVVNHALMVGKASHWHRSGYHEEWWSHQETRRKHDSGGVKRGSFGAGF